MKKLVHFLEERFEFFTEKVSRVLGHSFSFFIAILIVIMWISLDIIRSSNWHEIVNDLVFSFTFLMVFILQKMQNKFSAVVNIKLNELVASHENASNRLIKAEDMTEEDIRKLLAYYERLSASLEKKRSHSGAGSIEHVLNEDENKDDKKNEK
jgi:low affinity Fe/Cu permease